MQYHLSSLNFSKHHFLKQLQQPQSEWLQTGHWKRKSRGGNCWGKGRDWEGMERHLSLIATESVLYLSKLEQATQSIQPFTPSNKLHFFKNLLVQDLLIWINSELHEFIQKSFLITESFKGLTSSEHSSQSLPVALKKKKPENVQNWIQAVGFFFFLSYGYFPQHILAAMSSSVW